MRNLPHGFDIYLVNVKTMRKIVQIFVAFSEKLKFTCKNLNANLEKVWPHCAAGLAQCYFLAIACTIPYRFILSTPSPCIKRILLTRDFKRLNTVQAMESALAKYSVHIFWEGHISLTKPPIRRFFVAFLEYILTNFT